MCESRRHSACETLGRPAQVRPVPGEETVTRRDGAVAMKAQTSCCPAQRQTCQALSPGIRTMTEPVDNGLTSFTTGTARREARRAETQLVVGAITLHSRLT